MFNPHTSLQLELGKKFIEELTKDSKSIHHNMEYIEVLEYIIENHITFDIDETTEAITEKGPDRVKKNIFEKNHKNDNATKHLKNLIKHSKKEE